MDLKVFLVACEASGDRIAAKLMQEIKLQVPNVKFFGMGGMHMRAAGLKLVTNEFGIGSIGFLEIVLKFLKYYALLKLLVERAIKFQPDLVVTVDSWDFCSKIVSRLKPCMQSAWRACAFNR